MNRKILAFGASNSKNSINRKLATFAAHQFSDAEVQLLDLNDFEMPIYSIDREQETGIPTLAQEFKAHIQSADLVVISFAEHNGAYTTAFKNILDWISRLEGSAWADKPMLLLSTSPGGRGGKSVLEIATNSFKRWTKNTVVSFSLPSFHKNFSEETGITDESLLAEFREKVNVFKEVSWIGN